MAWRDAESASSTLRRRGYKPPDGDRPLQHDRDRNVAGTASTRLPAVVLREQTTSSARTTLQPRQSPASQRFRDCCPVSRPSPAASRLSRITLRVTLARTSGGAPN